MLDYGVFSSFAPIYDSDAGEITELEVSDVIWSKRQRIHAKRKAFASLQEVENDVEMMDAPPASTEPVIDPALELDSDLRAALEQLQFESGIDDLLEKNAHAMQRLVGLQNQRLAAGEKVQSPQVDGEEWKLGELSRCKAAAVMSHNSL